MARKQSAPQRDGPPRQVRTASRPSAVPTQRQRPFIQRYRGPLLGGIIVVILAALAVIFAIKFGPSNSAKEQVAGDQPADPAVVAALTQIPAATFDAVGAGSASNPPKQINGPALTSDGKPEVFYVGAEYCPFCAAERWAMIAALSRFGSFSNLHTTRSSASDAFPSTPTFTFYQSTYTSQYLSFVSVEQETNQPSDNGYTPLQSLSSDQQAIVSKYDEPPYVPANSAGAIPFVDFGGQYILAGATYGPGVLSGMNWSQIAAALSQPSSAQAQGIIGSANVLTSTFCQVTGQQPAPVCQSAGVQKAAALLKGG